MAVARCSVRGRAIGSAGFWAAGGLGIGLSFWKAEVDVRALVGVDGRAQVVRMVAEMVPPEMSISFLTLMAWPVVETLQISIMGMVIAISIAVPMSLFATSTLTWTGILHERDAAASRVLGFAPYAMARSALSVLRSVPEFVWALMFVRAVGLGPAAGALAIGVTYGGMLGKVYSEILEGVNLRPAESLQASGAGRVSVIAYGMVPAALPALVSYTLYRWECAIRTSAVLGFVGAGGIGQQIELSLRMFNFRELATLLIMLWLFVIVVEAASASVRRRLVR
jgi:phosphonate transport system permease protein